MLESFLSKDVKEKCVHQWFLQVDAYFETHAISANANWLRMVQYLFWEHVIEW
jgi:hypothetical protein